MRQLSPGDVARKLAQIEKSSRSRRWRRRAKDKLLQDVGAQPHSGGLDTPKGRVCAKRRFHSFNAAIMALADTRQSPNPYRKERRIYHCGYCGGWHLTSQEYREDYRDGENTE